MTRLPTLKPRQVIAALKKAGFIEHHQSGGHRYLWHPEHRRLAPVAVHPGNLKRPVLKAIIKESGLTEDEFRMLL